VVHFVPGPLDEHAAKYVGSLFLARDEHAGAGPGQTALALLDIHTQVERREPCQMPDALGDELVERNAVAKSAAPGMRRRREKTIVGGMSAVDVRMRDAAEHGKLIPMFLKELEVGRQSIVSTGVFGKKLVGQQP